MVLGSARCPLLPEDAVHIWIATTEDCQQPELLKRYLAVLDEQERSRYERFRFERHRQGYLIAHGLLRFCLSHYGEQQPWEWRFVTNDYGRPEIFAEGGVPPLRFNLSHTDGLAACAVTRAADVGVDVECVARSGDLAAVGELSFTAQELAQLDQLTGEAWRDRFFDLWTLKEAYAKARGMGLSLPLQQFAFGFDGALIQFESLAQEESAGSGADWRFGLMSPGSGHRLAVAVRGSGPLVVQVSQVVPGSVVQPLELPLIGSRGVVRKG
ncbi:MAG: 4'-phosphopantetheinyl transferase superfamily protein [Cyanobacteria bacterium P01_A01_bin.135]